MTIGSNSDLGAYELLAPQEWDELKGPMRRTICGSRYVLDSDDPPAVARDLMEILGVVPC